MRTLRTTALLGVLLASVSAGAQTYYTGDPQPSGQVGSFYGAVTYQLGIGIGNTHDYIGDVSWRGLGLDLNWMVYKNVSVGLALGWNVFYQNSTQVITKVPGGSSPGIAIYGNQDRSFNFFPILAEFRFIPKLKNDIRPFGGLGIGGYITTQQLGIGLYSYSTTQFQFALAPELGVIVPISGGAAAQISLRYNMAFPSGTIQFQQWLGIYLGVAWGQAL